MKKKTAMARPRNTLAKRLRNCRSNEERWFLLHTGAPCPSELERLFFSVLELRNAEKQWYFSEANRTEAVREIFAKWRSGLEQRTGKLLLPILLNGDSKALHDFANIVKRMEARNADDSPEKDSLRFALLKLFRHFHPRLPGTGDKLFTTTWQELEKQLAELKGGGHDRKHIYRVMKELGIWGRLMQIIPAKRRRGLVANKRLRKL